MGKIPNCSPSAERIAKESPENVRVKPGKGGKGIIHPQQSSGGWRSEVREVGAARHRNQLIETRNSPHQKRGLWTLRI